MGQVVPAFEAELRAQVGGEVIEASPEFIPGGRFQKGDVVVSVDFEDYMLAQQKQEAIVKQATAALALEMGRQNVAKNELKILARTTGRKLENPALALRAPQLLQAQAALDIVQSDLAKADLDMERTTVRAPFNAILTQRNVSPGDKVTAQESIATMVSTDEYWVRLSVPVDDLQWLMLPGEGVMEGSEARVVMDGLRGERSGYLLRMTGTLDQTSRLAGMIVVVPDPLLLWRKDGTDEKATPLILGDYVKVELEGRDIENAARIKLQWLRDGNTVWIKEGQTLRIVPATVIYEDREYAYLSAGLSAGQEIVTSNIPVPVDGLKIRTMEEARAAVHGMMKGPKGPNE